MAVLCIHRKHSYQLAIILSLAHLATAGLLWLLELPLGIKAIAAVALVFSLIYYLRQDALLTASDAVVVLVLSDEMQCILTTRSDELIVCSILGSTFVAPYLTVLNLQPVGKFFTCSVVILPDGIDAEEFRQLRVWLRWKWKNSKERP
ncbi:protein YgfX [Nitrosomonas sp.]|uniref:protein YgfX n=1 Tax=Nitrosomonas sp. TaxID=42353 RepID=UPI0025FE95C1|nr:protein YgfX [Nitrosomonas sp.]